MRRTTKKKTIAATAFLLFLLIIAFLVPHFLGNSVDACGRHKPPHHHPCPPPLGKTIIKHFIYPDETPIGECLEVELWDDGTEPLMTAHTDAEGKVVFPGLFDGTYTIEYKWQGIHYEEKVRINCSRITWEFYNEVPYWTIEKTFYYDTETTKPISHLNVSLYKDDTLVEWKLTDVNGFVAFQNLKAGNYTLEWVWGGVTKTEDVSIGFQTESPVVLTNKLEPKSGGGK
jgi:hypothetical protein